MEKISVPTLSEIEQAWNKLGDKIRHTPVWQWKSDVKDDIFGRETEIFLKLELLQYGGSFKCRGTLMNMLDLSEEQLARGVTAVSAGNHAISVAYSAKELQTSAKVVMPKTANQAKVDRCESLGAEVILVDNVHIAFEMGQKIEKEEGRLLVHPYEGPLTALGTATVGFELASQVGNLDAIVVPVGGGGLIAGISCYMKQLNPDIKIFGVEPEGANTMNKSFASGRPEEIENVTTIADSLGAPYAAPYSFGLSYKFVDRMVTVSDKEMTSTMELFFNDMKLAVEPAGASATAGIRFPLLNELKGKRVGVIVCGTNIDVDTYYKNIKKQVNA